MGEVKNFKKEGKAVAQAVANVAKNPKAAIKGFKALLEGGNSKINNTRAALMLFLALFLDVISLLELVPFIGWIVGPLVKALSWLIFYIWFKVVGCDFFSSKSVGSKITTAIADSIPGIGAVIPGIMIDVLVAIMYVRIGEFGTSSAQSTGEEGGGEQKENAKTKKRGGPDRATNIRNARVANTESQLRSSATIRMRNGVPVDMAEARRQAAEAHGQSTGEEGGERSNVVNFRKGTNQDQKVKASPEVKTPSRKAA